MAWTRWSNSLVGTDTATTRRYRIIEFVALLRGEDRREELGRHVSTQIKALKAERRERPCSIPPRRFPIGRR
jgi:hypothetical protein